MRPRVSIVIPCFNERHTILGLLQAISDQTFPVEDLEIILANGMSTDGTREVIRAFSSEHPSLSIDVIDNPNRIIPAALNRAIEAARGDIIVRFDAHSMPKPDYVERSLMILKSTGAANVGGIWEIHPSTEGWVGRSIAVAAAHPLGAGDARYRTGGEAGEVDTVPFGTYRREWLDKVGSFNENLLTNEDYEFNVRLRQAGGVIWFDPSIRSIYFARPNFSALARQYARYGFWKAKMLRIFPGSIRWRQVLPPLFILTLIILGIVSFFWYPALILLYTQMGIYGLVIIMTALIEAFRRRDLPLIIGFPLAILFMHFAWGGAFIWGAIQSFFGGRHHAT